MSTIHGTIIRRRGQPSLRSRLQDMGIGGDAIIAMYLQCGRRLVPTCERLEAVSGISTTPKTLALTIHQIEAERQAAAQVEV